MYKRVYFQQQRTISPFKNPISGTDYHYRIFGPIKIILSSLISVIDHNSRERQSDPKCRHFLSSSAIRIQLKNKRVRHIHTLE